MIANPRARMKAHETPRKNWGIIATVAVMFLAGAYGIYSLLSDNTQPRKRVMETVQLKLVAPPPPPPPKVEPPPEPPKMVEEQKIEPPVDKPDDKPPPEAPPPGPLALDAAPGAGGDAFGLGAKPGGRDYVLGGNQGGTGFGNRFGHYASLMQSEIERQFHKDDELNLARFRTTIKVWLSDAGKIQKVELMTGTGNGQLDQRIEQAIATMPVLPEAPPQQMPQPIIVRIGATPGLG